MKQKQTFLIKVACLAILVVLITCVAHADAPSSSPDLDNKILKELTELHKEIKVLRREVSQLWQAVSEIHRRSVKAPTLKPAPVVTATLDFVGKSILGDSQAKVGIVEFSDYQCPFCRRFDVQTFDKIKSAYIDTGKVQYMFRDFPLNFHKEAKGAAIAANCAGEQDSYWEMRHALFKNQRRLGSGVYDELAKGFKLDMQAFKACQQEAGSAQRVEDDLAYGGHVGVQAAPSFFVGQVKDGKLVDARLINGAQPWMVFKKAIDELIK